MKSKKPIARRSVKRGEGYAIFSKDVPASEKYRVTSKPIVYPTRKEAQAAFNRMPKDIQRDCKILKY